jgi:ABC-2 type transport system permease protein
MRTARAFAYLIRATMRNRTAERLRRVRHPRYLLGAAIGLAYIWYFLVRYSGEADNPFAFLLTPQGHVFTTVAFFAVALTAWVVGGDRTALAFSRAEVHFLFPAPLSRRALVAYKLVRAQLAILVNVALWTLMLRRGTDLPVLVRLLSLWLIFTTMNLHRLGAALVRSSLVEHRQHGYSRHRVALMIFGAMVAAVGVSLIAHYPLLAAASGPREFLLALFEAFTTPPASVALWPFTAVLAPLYAATTADWLAALPPVLLVFGVHFAWVMRAHAGFEEAALAASEERARLIEAWRKRQWDTRHAKDIAKVRGFPMPRRGPAAVAVVWKNLLCLRRTFQLSGLIVILLPAFPAMVLFGIDYDGERGFMVAQAVAGAMVAIAGFLALLGPRIVRNDLRQDMANIVALKALPMRGHTIVAAEVLSSAVPIVIVQYVLLCVAAAAALAAPWGFATPSFVAAVLAGALPTLLAFNVASVTVQNAAPVLFPAWTKLGPTAPTGIDALGQNIISVGLILLMLGLMLIPAGALGVTAGALLSGYPAVAVGAGLLVGSAVLSAEAYMAMRYFGSVLERTEPAQVA